MLSKPYIPETITVHLGRPDDTSVENVTVPFIEYIKNVASSEIFPTWNENALRANIYVIVTYALNRLYTEWYRSKGYDFDITSTTQYDQAFVYGRDIFENISHLVDELFDDYVTKQGNIEPYFTSFCNGTTVTCSGLSQWGSQELAQKGYVPYDINLLLWQRFKYTICWNSHFWIIIPRNTFKVRYVGQRYKNYSSAT